MRARASRIAFALVLALAAPALAHEVRPAYLVLRELEAERYDASFRVPALAELRLSLHAQLPSVCSELGPRAVHATPEAFTERWTIACSGGLVGREIRIDGLTTTLTEVLVRIERLDGSTQLVRVFPSAPSFVVAAAPRPAQIARTYTGLGVEHIWLGVDHLLFVLALLLVVRGGRRLVGTVTAFTAAHSLTLAGATLGFVYVPQQPVEAVIALSIVFVAREIARARAGVPGLTARAPWLVAFAFGLLHGFGFAGALHEIGLPEQAIPLALLFFNVGVELGQLAFVAGALALAALGRRLLSRAPVWLEPLACYGIGSAAAYWTIERIARFSG
jgi:hydrogenase/urease accessory protein HupE